MITTADIPMNRNTDKFMDNYQVVHLNELVQRLNLIPRNQIEAILLKWEITEKAPRKHSIEEIKLKLGINTIEETEQLIKNAEDNFKDSFYTMIAGQKKYEKENQKDAILMGKLLLKMYQGKALVPKDSFEEKKIRLSRAIQKLSSYQKNKIINWDGKTIPKYVLDKIKENF